MKKCDLEGCTSDAEFQIGLKMWAIALNKKQYTEKNCLRILTSVCCCQKCVYKVEASHFINEESQPRIFNTVSKLGGRMPNWNTAELHFEPIIDEPQDLTKVVGRM